MQSATPSARRAPGDEVPCRQRTLVGLTSGTRDNQDWLGAVAHDALRGRADKKILPSALRGVTQDDQVRALRLRVFDDGPKALADQDIEGKPPQLARKAALIS